MDVDLFLMAKFIGHAGLVRVPLNAHNHKDRVGVATSVKQVVVSTGERDWCFPLWTRS